MVKHKHIWCMSVPSLPYLMFDCVTKQLHQTKPSNFSQIVDDLFFVEITSMLGLLWIKGEQNIQSVTRYGSGSITKRL